MECAGWSEVAEQAAKQSGLITREQALAFGFPKGSWDYLVRSGRLGQVDRGLYEVNASGDLQNRDLHGALLLAGPGAVLSHRSAARLQGLWGVDGVPLEVTTPRRIITTTPGLAVHRGTVPEEDQRLVRGLPTTNLVRTVLDLAPLLDMSGLAALLESARKRDKKMLTLIETRMSKLRWPPEVNRRMELLLRDCERRARPFDSPYEVQFWHRWPYSGLPMPEPQFEVRVKGHPRRFIDFAFTREQIAIETQGYNVRMTKKSFDDDSGRSMFLTRYGWYVLAVSYEVFRERFGQLVQTVRSLLHTRRLILASGVPFVGDCATL